MEMNDNGNCKAEPKIPEFQKILDKFKDELENLNDRAYSVRAKTFILRDFSSPDKSVSEDQPMRTGVIGELEDCLDRFNKYNSILKEANDGLVNLVG